MKRYWIIGAVLILIFASALIPLTRRQDLGWIDSISGSQKRQTVWRFGVSSSPAVSESLLAKRYHTLGLTWEPDWKNVKGTYIDLFGRSVGSGHGLAPAIYTLGMSADLQQWYLAAASDDEVREFFRVMVNGTDSEKTAAVEAAYGKALSTRSATQPGQ